MDMDIGGDIRSPREVLWESEKMEYLNAWPHEYRDKAQFILRAATARDTSSSDCRLQSIVLKKV